MISYLQEPVKSTKQIFEFMKKPTENTSDWCLESIYMQLYKMEILYSWGYILRCSCDFSACSSGLLDVFLPLTTSKTENKDWTRKMNDVIKHYDALIDEKNDPVYDPKPLQDYMNLWDGQMFLDEMKLDQNKTVLEIGVGTGRLAMRVAPFCKAFFGIDISPKTAKKAEENLNLFSNTIILCLDFMDYQTEKHFDVIYSSLTFMHIKDKKAAIRKIAELLNDDGIFVLSIDKNQNDIIDCGTRQIPIFPDHPSVISKHLIDSEMKILKQYETEFAHIFVSTHAI